MTAINQILGITASDYGELYLEKYMRWCMSYATNNEGDLQKLLANSAISKWYKKEYEKLEEKFYNDLEPFADTLVSRREIADLYYKTTLDMFNLYPKPLFEVARKIKIINDISAN